jgi:DNA gyrase inhibitor GyrI
VRENKDGFILQAQGKETESIVQFRTSGGNWASLEVTLPREMHSPEVDDIYKSWQPFLKGNYDRVP